MKILLPLSWVYGLVVLLRNRMFDWGLLKSTDIGVPVISVGNLTAGGTGKTPLVECIVRQLLDGNRRVAVVSRGYKRKSRGVIVVSNGTQVQVDVNTGGDEPVQIARKFPGAVVVVGERRVEAANTAVEQYGADVVVMDDGFQHRYLHRALDVVVIDSQHEIFRESLLPAGRKREPMSSLGRAQCVVLSHAGEETSEVRWRSALKPWYSGPVAAFRYAVRAVRINESKVLLSPEEYSGRRVFAFSGIGNPDQFLETLRSIGMNVVGQCSFSDHHTFTSADTSRVLTEAVRSKADICVTTEKDITRLGSSELLEMFSSQRPLWYTEIGVSFVFGEQEFMGLLEECTGRGSVS